MLARLRQTYIPIFTQITAPFVLLALLIAAGGTYIVTRLVFDSVEERFTNQLVETTLLAKESLLQQEKELLEALRLTSHIQGVDTAVQGRQFQELNTLILPVVFNSSLEAFAILDSRGFNLMALHSNDQGNAYESLGLVGDFSDYVFVRKVLSGVVEGNDDKFSGFVTTENGEYFFVSGPIHDATGDLVGAMLIGNSVQGLADKLRASSFGQVTLYTLSGDLLSSTLSQSSPLGQAAVAESLARQDEGSPIRSLTDNNINYNEMLTPWDSRGGEDIGVMGVAIPTQFLVRASQVTRGNTFVLMTVSFLLVIVVGLVVARRISSPIRKLRDAAVQVGEGNLGVKVDHPGRDEVGVLAESFNQMVRSLDKSQTDLVAAYDKTIEGWGRATDLRDHETEGHSQRVAELSVTLANAMGIKGQQLVHLRRGALLHDIGKIAIPDHILLKQGKLTPIETERMRQHPEYARSFIEQIEFLEPAMAIPYNHHEKWDGSGYPQGLRGEQIPLEARIFSVVDVWDALTSERPYRGAQSFADTLAYIKAESGKYFDPAVVEAFVKLMGR